MIFLITDAYLISNTTISKEIDVKLINVAMKQVTIADMKPLLSNPLYELYESHVKDNTSLTPTQETLFEQVKYYMALRTERAMLGNLLSVNNKGVTQDEHAANMDVVTFKRKEIDSTSAIIKKNILTYLQDNKPEFPEYFPEITPQSNPQANSIYSAGIAFDFEPKRYFM